IEPETTDDCVDLILIRECIRESFEDDDADAVPKNRASSLRVKSFAMSIGRRDLAILIQISGWARSVDRGRTGQRHIGVEIAKALTRQDRRDETGGTSRLNVDARPCQIQLVRDTARHVVAKLSLHDMTFRDGAAVRVWIDTTAAEDTDASRARGVIAGV